MGNILIFYACPKFPGNVSFECSSSAKKSGYLGSTNEFLRTPMSDFVEMTRKLEDIFLQKKLLGMHNKMTCRIIEQARIVFVSGLHFSKSREAIKSEFLHYVYVHVRPFLYNIYVYLWYNKHKAMILCWATLCFFWFC